MTLRLVETCPGCGSDRLEWGVQPGGAKVYLGCTYCNDTVMSDVYTDELLAHLWERRSAVTLESMHAGEVTASGWTVHGYSPESQAYWQGMRDTLRVILGITTEPPRHTGEGADVAADELLRKRT